MRDRDKSAMIYMSTVKSLYKLLSLPPKWIGLYRYSQLPSSSLLKSISIYNLPQLIFHSVEQMNLPPYN